MINKREILLGGLGLAFPQAAWAADEIKLPLGRNADGDWTVQVSINDQGPFTFQLDIGNGASSIPAPLANRLGLQLIGDALEPYIVQVGVQKYPGFRVNAANVRFGDKLTRKNMVFMRAPAAAYREFDGEIGSALALAKPSIFNPVSSEICIYPNGQMPLDGFISIPATVKRSGVNTSAIVLECLFLGQTSRLGLTMTNINGIYLRSAFVRKHGLWDRFPDYAERNSQQSNSPNGQWEKFHDFVAPEKNLEKAAWRIVNLKDFSIGSFKFDSVDAWLCDPGIEDELDNELEGFVGCDLLSRYSMAFGEKNQVLLKPNTSRSVNG
jgi:hypothetical protein